MVQSCSPCCKTPRTLADKQSTQTNAGRSKYANDMTANGANIKIQWSSSARNDVIFTVIFILSFCHFLPCTKVFLPAGKIMVKSPVITPHGKILTTLLRFHSTGAGWFHAICTRSNLTSLLSIDTPEYGRLRERGNGNYCSRSSAHNK